MTTHKKLEIQVKCETLADGLFLQIGRIAFYRKSSKRPAVAEGIAPASSPGYVTNHVTVFVASRQPTKLGRVVGRWEAPSCPAQYQGITGTPPATRELFLFFLLLTPASNLQRSLTSFTGHRLSIRSMMNSAS